MVFAHSLMVTKRHGGGVETSRKRVISQTTWYSLHLVRDMFTLGRTGELFLRVPISKGLYILHTGRIVCTPKKVSLFTRLRNSQPSRCGILLFLRLQCEIVGLLSNYYKKDPLFFTRYLHHAIGNLRLVPMVNIALCNIWDS